MKKNYFVYILRCSDNSLYTGITTNVARRFFEHRLGKGAKYTKSKKVEKIELILGMYTKSVASKIEIKIKSLKKSEKENIIKNQYFLSLNNLYFFKDYKD